MVARDLWSINCPSPQFIYYISYLNGPNSAATHAIKLVGLIKSYNLQDKGNNYQWYFLVNITVKPWLLPRIQGWVYISYCHLQFSIYCNENWKWRKPNWCCILNTYRIRVIHKGVGLGYVPCTRPKHTPMHWHAGCMTKRSLPEPGPQKYVLSVS